MNRRSVGVIALLLAFAAIAFVLLRRGDDTKPAAPSTARSGATKVGTQAKSEAPDEAPPGGPMQWSLDKDPEGPLRLEGQVVGPDGAGVGGAQVSLATVPPRTVTADEDGTFAFDKLVGRTYTIAAFHDELVGGPFIYKLAQGVDPVVIHLSAGAAVDVRVVNDKQDPIAGATVTLRDLSHREAKTDDKGMAAIKPVTPGWVAVEATAPGYATSGGMTTVGAAGGRGNVTLTLQKGTSVAGTVKDEHGKLLGGVRVTARSDASWGGWGAGEPPAATTDDSGAFSFAALAPGSVTLVAVDGEHAPAYSELVKVSTTPITGVAIVMSPGGVLHGTVVDAAGAVVPFAGVRIAGQSRNGQVAARQTTTDKVGAFEIRGLSRSKLQARAESDTAASALADVDLTTKPDVELKLVLDVAGTISGIVVDEKGSPVPEVSVNAWPDMMSGAKGSLGALTGFSATTTDGAGHFTIRGLPDDDYRLFATRDNGTDSGWGKKTITAKVGEKNARIELPSNGGLKGTIVIEGDGPPKRATVQIGFGAPTPTNAGVFDIHDVAPGTYDVTFHSLEFTERIQRAVTIEPAKTTDLGTITVVKGRVMTGVVVDQAGRPVAGAKVRVGERLAASGGDDDGQLDQWDALANIRSATSGADGTFTIIGIPSKPNAAAAEHPDKGRSLPIEVPPGDGDPPQVRLILRGFGTISGKVLERGKPMAGIAVDEVTKGSPAQNSFAVTRDDGSFILERVPEGTHVLTANKRAGMQSRGGASTVIVKAGQTTTATIELPAGDISLAVTIRPAAGAKLDSAQLFLFGGNIAVDNGQALIDATLAGGTVLMKFWFGPDKPLPVFDELPAGPYSLCSIPITGDMNDATFVQRIQENIPSLRVVCTPVMVKPSPSQQSLAQELPAMQPLPPV
jgi:protocatechuate 3,4-dioxygenase beta subunit